MAISLYDLSVVSFRQTVDAVAGILAKGRKHMESTGANVDAAIDERICADMLPLKFQIASVAHHSAGAIEGVTAGKSGPPAGVTLETYADLEALIASTQAKLAAIKPDDVNALEGKDVTFELGTFKIPFNAEGYLMSFALPNLHFHATTAYDILRGKGVPLGKRDYLGALRVKT